MKLKAWLQGDDLEFVTVFEVDNQDFAPDVIKWRDAYFVRRKYRDESDTMHVVYVHGSFEDFSSKEATQ